MSLEAWGDENPDDAEADRFTDAGWIDPDTAMEWMHAIMRMAPHFQGGHSTIGQEVADIVGTGFPIHMDGLRKRALEMKMDPAELWPWLPPSPESQDG